MQISKYLTLAEATRSARATELKIPNNPTPEHIENMKWVASKVFDPCREFVGGALFASSFYRSAELNAKTPGASKTSQHSKGEAIDIDCKKYGNGTNADVFYFILNNLDFDQIIWEYGTDKQPDWVHVSLKRVGKNRKQARRKYANDPIYYPFKKP